MIAPLVAIFPNSGAPLSLLSVKYRLPSDPTVIPIGCSFAVGIVNSLAIPAGVIRPMPWLTRGVNHRLPSGPATMYSGPQAGVNVLNSVIAPVGVIRPILLAAYSVNHKLPSGPAVMPRKSLPALGTANSPVTTPLGVIRPILLAPFSVNHKLPSGPFAMNAGVLLAVVMGNSVTVPPGVILPILFVVLSVNHRLPSGPAVIPPRPLPAETENATGEDDGTGVGCGVDEDVGEGLGEGVVDGSGVGVGMALVETKSARVVTPLEGTVIGTPVDAKVADTVSERGRGPAKIDQPDAVCVGSYTARYAGVRMGTDVKALVGANVMLGRALNVIVLSVNR